MAKSNKYFTEGWTKTVDNVFEDNRKKDNQLTPSKMQINTITSFAANINNTTQLIKNASDMAHEGIIDFEMAQKIIDNQKKNIANDIKYLKSYLEIDINK